MAPNADALLAAWEAGAGEPRLDRAPSLLRSLGRSVGNQSVAALTVGQCDEALFRLRRELFGDLIEAVAACPGCGAQVEMALSASQLQPRAAHGRVTEVEVEAEGYRLAVRLATNADLSALAEEDPPPGADALLARCLLAAHGPDGSAAALGAVPQRAVLAALEAMAGADPGAQILLRLRCPCGAEWDDELDIRAILWTELSDWVGRTLTEVHQLASAYGWTEAEILSMSAWRRHWYLEAAGW